MIKNRTEIRKKRLIKRKQKNNLLAVSSQHNKLQYQITGINLFYCRFFFYVPKSIKVAVLKRIDMRNY